MIVEHTKFVVSDFQKSHSIFDSFTSLSLTYSVLKAILTLWQNQPKHSAVLIFVIQGEVLIAVKFLREVVDKS